MKFNATIELKPAEIEQIIREAIIKSAPGIAVGVIKFELTTEYDRWDNKTSVFSGAKVSIKPAAAQG